MLEELTTKEKVVGIKQVRRLIREGRVRQVYLACDADPWLIQPVEDECRKTEIPTVTGYTMKQLGHAAGIEVGTAAAALAK